MAYHKVNEFVTYPTEQTPASCAYESYVPAPTAKMMSSSAALKEVGAFDRHDHWLATHNACILVVQSPVVSETQVAGFERQGVLCDIVLGVAH